MNKDDNCKQGTLKVSEEVISTVTRLAALEIDGVVKLAPAKTTVKNIFIKPKQGAVQVQAIGDVVEVTVGIIVKQGWKVSSVAEAVQLNVKQSIQNMTGILVSKINVFIASVAFEEESGISA